MKLLKKLEMYYFLVFFFCYEKKGNFLIEILYIKFLIKKKQ